MSLMRAHQERIHQLKFQQDENNRAEKVYFSDFKKWKQKLALDQKAVRTPINHIDRNKIAAKKIDNYTAYLRQWLKTGNQHQNEILSQCVIWAVDGQRWDVLLEFADPCIKYKDTIGSAWKMVRSMDEFITEETLKTADRLKKEKKDISKIPLAEIEQRIDSGRWKVGRVEDGEWQDNHVLIARLNRFLGIEAEEKKATKQAAQYYAKAHHRYPNIAVKRRLIKMCKQLNINCLLDDGKTVKPLNTLLKEIA